MALLAARTGKTAHDSVTAFKHIVAGTSADNNYMTFESPVGTDYQVTAGKTFYVTKIKWAGNTAAGQVQIGYGDTGVADAAPAPTNAVTMSKKWYVQAAYVEYEQDVLIAIPAAKFPYMRGLNGSSVSTCALEGYEA